MMGVSEYIDFFARIHNRKKKIQFLFGNKILTETTDEKWSNCVLHQNIKI